MVHMVHTMVDPQTIQHLYRFLNDYKTVTIATAVDNTPWISSVFFAPASTMDEAVHAQKTTMYCTVMKGSLKLKNIGLNPKIAFSIQEALPSRWLQGVGIASEVMDSQEYDQALQRIIQKSPEAEGFVKSVPMTVAKVEIEFVKITDITVNPPLFLNFAFSARKEG